MTLMKTYPILVTLSLCALLAGCASGQHGLVLAPVGPAPDEATAPSTQGTLVVFSAYDVHEANPGDYEHRHHYSAYRIFSGDGKLLQKVRNDSNTVLREPAHVRLPARHVSRRRRIKRLRSRNRTRGHRPESGHHGASGRRWLAAQRVGAEQS